jgi:pimeloyl-ACP methyl ester carboxylesterase
VQPHVARRTRVCAWDRAGYGFSSASAEPQDVRHTEADLEAALEAARIEGPYVLVGHSLGGYESLQFADRRPGDVAGMVLVDPSIPDQLAVMERDVGPEAAAIEDASRNRTSAFLQTCEAGVRAHTIRPDADPSGCFRLPPEFPPALKAALRARLADPALFATKRSLEENTDDSGRLIVNPARDYGHMPLIVLTAGVVPPPPRELQGPAAIGQGFTRYFQGGWRAGHVALARLSACGRHRVVEGSGHFIQREKPQAVVEAIDEVLARPRC